MKEEIDIAILIEKVSKVEAWIIEADINHFPTIEKRFDKVELKLAFWGGGLGVLTVVTPILIKILWK